MKVLFIIIFCWMTSYVNAQHDKATYSAYLQKKAIAEKEAKLSAWKNATHKYYVRTTNSKGIVPVTNVLIFNGKGKSMVTGFKTTNDSVLLNRIDSLIKVLDTCAACKSIKTVKPLDSISTAVYNYVKLNTGECLQVYGQPLFKFYTKDKNGKLLLFGKASKGCGLTEQHNLEIDELLKILTLK